MHNSGGTVGLLPHPGRFSFLKGETAVFLFLFMFSIPKGVNHVMKDLPRYKVGDKIAQLHLDFTFPANFTEVNQLDITERGEDGFGSTDLEVQENNE